MGNWTIALSTEYETALLERTTLWLAGQPETAWTPQLVLETMITSDLHSELRKMDQELGLLVTSALQLTAAQRRLLIGTLSASRQRRFRQLIGEPPA